jgi:hypothetical protein
MKIIRESFHLSPLNFAPLRLGGKNFRARVLSATRSFAQATQIPNDRNKKNTKAPSL